MSNDVLSMSRAIFAVEESQIIRDELMSSIEELVEGVRLVGSAQNEAQAVAWFGDSANAWDDAVIDLFYKHGSGLGVLAAIQARRPDQRAIMLTNYLSEVTKAKCTALGANAIFDKSTELDDFFAYLRAGG
jgi:ActR/RegA family two-component response regulator